MAAEFARSTPANGPNEVVLSSDSSTIDSNVWLFTELASTRTVDSSSVKISCAYAPVDKTITAPIEIDRKKNFRLIGSSSNIG